MLAGYEALRQDAAWFDLSSRGVISATGRDRARLLHNLTTNDVKGLAPGEGCYAFLLTPQGRIQADVNIFREADRLRLDTEPETRERLAGLIAKYIIADDVTLESVPCSVIAVEGPRAAAVLASAGAPAPETAWGHATWNEALVANVSETGQPGYRIFAQEKESLIAALESAGAVQAGSAAVRAVRLENGKPRYGEDILENSLVQETRQMHAVSFTKGCYLGQEIVERVRARGHVNRLLMKVRIEGTEPPPAGTKLLADGAEAGEITSAAFSLALGKVAALAYVRAPHAQPGTAFTAGGCPAVLE